MLKLTEAAILKLKPKDTRYEVLDSELKGFGVRINPSGKLSFFVKGEYLGNPFRLTLDHSDVTNAKEQARSILGEASRGSDPRGLLRSLHHHFTLEDVAERYLTEELPKLRQSTQNVYRWVIRAILVAKLGSVRVGAIDVETCQELHASLSETPRQANMALSILSKLLEIATSWGWRVGDNPVRMVVKNAQEQRLRILSKDELDSLMTTINRMLSSGSANYYALVGIKMLVMTGQRKDLIRTLKWSQIDFASGFIHFPMGKGKKDRLFPLSPSVRLLLEAMPSKHMKYVFPASRKSGAISTFDDVWKVLKVAAGLQDVHLNDLRHTFANHLIQNDVAMDYVGEMLGAMSPQSLSRYKHLEQLRKAAIDIA